MGCREEAQELLSNTSDGTYLVRKAATAGDYTLTLRWVVVTSHCMPYSVVVAFVECVLSLSFIEKCCLFFRKGHRNRLIKIYHRNGKYGLAEPYTYDAVQDLIEYYSHCSLAEYNVQLDCTLDYPVDNQLVCAYLRIYVTHCKSQLHCILYYQTCKELNMHIS